jgi:DNA-directed RNA polymerase subunit RPC12/RpoP
MPESLKISCYHCGQKLDVGELEPFSRIACPVCNTRIIVPKPFGNLLLEENLGAGLMADVFRAMDITLDRDIAVKVLRPEFSRDSDVSRQFISEARSASAINHPNIIPIYSCGEMDEMTYIIMQFMEGGDRKSVV